MQKAPLAAVAQTKNFHEVLLENVHGLVFVKDQDFRIVYANKAFLELYPPEERGNIIGRASAENFTEEQAKVFNAEDQKAFDTGFAELVEEISDYKGRTYMLQTQKIRFTDEQGNIRILGISTDITRLVEREKLLAKSNVALENFAAVAAHDLRSPLAALSVSLDLIRNDHDTSMGPRTARHVELMSTCLEGLMEQVSELLATYKLDKNDEGPHTDCDLSILFEEVKFSLSSSIQWAQAKVLSTELPRLKVNKSLFRQLMHNLIENSIKYRGDQKPIIIMRYEDMPDEHVFSIEDNGVGVELSQKDRIFIRGTQGDFKNDGCGIGLSLCKQIIEKHAGRIWLDEKFNTGCRIYFTLPKFPVAIS